MSKKNTLRKIEAQILARLDENSRTPFLWVGKKIKRSQQQVSYTVKSLIEREILDGFYSIVDYSKFDVLNFRVYFKVGFFNKEKFDKIIKFLVGNEYTSWVTTCGGKYDLICTFFTSNPSQFNKTLKAIIADYPDQLQNYNILTTIVLRWFGRKYLSRTLPHEIIFGGDRAPVHLDNIDLNIVSELSDNARKSTVLIAENLSITPKTVMDRIKKLQKMEILIGYKPLLQSRKIGYVSNLVLIKFHNVRPETEDELVLYLKIHNNVLGIVKTIGEWDLEINVETIDSLEYRKFEMDIRQKFPLIIQHIDAVPLYHTYKLSFFPKFLVKAKSL